MRINLYLTIVSTIVFLGFYTNAHALGVSQVTVDASGITVKHQGTDKAVSFVGFDITQANADLLTDVIQELLDETINRATLPNDDEDKSTDPNRAGAFWISGNKITYRNTLATVFIENGLFNVRLETVDFND